MDKSNEAFEHLTFIKDAINISRMTAIAHHLLTNFSVFYICIEYVITNML